MTVAQITARKDTSVNWATANPILAAGEPGFDTTLKRLKIGDGVSSWACGRLRGRGARASAYGKPAGSPLGLCGQAAAGAWTNGQAQQVKRSMPRSRRG